ncbi:MAG: type IX secretion system membrane protein PorP/SprF [Saprospiraceae bacterium]|nr:type IX secretion system membrane protein PorP/SprF [Saprospiraceae bacterium]MBP7699336.1 type IX secretion system membrane protein PorP/SprF [Saprospiraceae bacterium]
MKKIGVLILVVWANFIVHAQQQQHYTQFMHNKLALNAGYAGSNEVACLSAIYRKQWIGLDGAPETQVLSFNTPLLNQKIGIGLSLVHNKIGITDTWTGDLAYAYRIRVSSNGWLGLGVNASFRNFTQNFADERLHATQPLNTDGSIPIGNQNKYVGNVGAGLYYNSPYVYAGVSVPRLIRNNIDFSDATLKVGTEVVHGYAMLGAIIPVSSSFKISPQGLLKVSENAPLDAEINTTLIFANKLFIGGSYRFGGSTKVGFGESVDIMLGVQIGEHLYLGGAYDITLSELKDYSSGSLEVLLRYCFGKRATTQPDEYINPRFF